MEDLLQVKCLHYLEGELQSNLLLIIVFCKVVISWLPVVSSVEMGEVQMKFTGVNSEIQAPRQRLGSLNAHHTGSWAECASVLKVSGRRGAFG